MKKNKDKDYNFKIGSFVLYQGQVCKIIDFDIETKNLKLNCVKNNNYKIIHVNNEDLINNVISKVSDEEIKKVQLVYLYKEEGKLYFFNSETRGNTSLDISRYPELELFLKPNSLIFLQLYDGNIIGIIFPGFISYQIMETIEGNEEGQKKAAVLDNGLLAFVPKKYGKNNRVCYNVNTGEFV